MKKKSGKNLKKQFNHDRARKKEARRRFIKMEY